MKPKPCPCETKIETLENERIQFSVPGIPRPGGSKRAFVNKKTGRAALVDAGGEKTRNWRQSVQVFARQAYQGVPLTGTLWLRLQFFFPRPKGHFGTGRNAGKLKSSAPHKPTVRPDLTKLVRSVEDALTGILWRDDAQIISQMVWKNYGKRPGVSVFVEEFLGDCVGKDYTENPGPPVPNTEGDN